MTDMEKVIRALGCFCDGKEKPDDCPCEFNIRNSHGCEWNVAKDTIALLKEQNERIKLLEHQLETITKWRANAGAFD